MLMNDCMVFCLLVCGDVIIDGIIVFFLFFICFGLNYFNWIDVGWNGGIGWLDIDENRLIILSFFLNFLQWNDLDFDVNWDSIWQVIDDFFGIGVGVIVMVVGNWDRNFFEFIVFGVNIFFQFGFNFYLLNFDNCIDVL